MTQEKIEEIRKRWENKPEPEKTWEEKNLDRYNLLDFEKDIIPLLRECAKVALSDKENKIQFTPLVLKNINLITNRDPMEISFQQWKSFMAYYNQNCKTEVVISNISKLGL